MKRKKKITRKELLKEPDKVLTFSGKLMMHIIEKKNQVAMVLGLTFAIALGVVVVRYVAERNEGRAYVMLEDVMARFDQLAESKGAEAAFKETLPDLQKIFDEFPNKNATKFGRVLYANIALKGGDAQRALDLYQQALADFETDPMVQNLIHSGMGYAYESMEKYPEAVAQFQMVVNSTDPMLKDEAYYKLGLIYAKIGKVEQSQDAFQKILTDYTDSIYYEIVKSKGIG